MPNAAEFGADSMEGGLNKKNVVTKVPALVAADETDEALRDATHTNALAAIEG